MGASGWSYFVPYQPDISQALQDLREKVFEEGDYFSVGDLFDMVQEDLKSELEFYKQDNPEIYDEMLKNVQPLLEIDATQPPKTIEEVLLRNQPDGTHSILDVDRITMQPDFMSVSPLPKKIILELFGTDKPTREMVETLERSDPGRICGSCERWQGIYLIIYQNGKATEIFFSGISGD